jgi:RNA polymerase sigma-70 factor (ECF subfamily)
VALVDLDRRLLERLLAKDQLAWQQFVDRFLGAVLHSVRHVAHLRSMTLDAHEVDDLAADFFKLLLDKDCALLRRFRGESSLATYLVVIARRFVVNTLAKRAAAQRRRSQQSLEDIFSSPSPPPSDDLESREEVESLLRRLKGREAALVRGYYLENKTYGQLSEDVGIPQNSIGPMLHRILAKLRKAPPYPNSAAG